MPLIQFVSRIQFDFGAIGLLNEELERLGLKRPLLITDQGVAAAGILQRALDAAAPLKPVIYDQTPENPNEAALNACLQLWQEHGCDSLIALGGGLRLRWRGRHQRGSQAWCWPIRATRRRSEVKSKSVTR